MLGSDWGNMTVTKDISFEKVNNSLQLLLYVETTKSSHFSYIFFESLVDMDTEHRQDKIECSPLLSQPTQCNAYFWVSLWNSGHPSAEDLN